MGGKGSGRKKRNPEMYRDEELSSEDAEAAAEAIPRVGREDATLTIEPGAQAHADATGSDAPRRRYRKRKVKDDGDELTRQGWAGLTSLGLTLTAFGYSAFRAPRRLEFDPDAKENFDDVSYREAQKRGLKMPWWLELGLAGAVLIGLPIVKAETGLDLGAMLQSASNGARPGNGTGATAAPFQGYAAPIDVQPARPDAGEPSAPGSTPPEV